MKCNNCGTNIENNKNFCSNCGNKIEINNIQKENKTLCKISRHRYNYFISF